MAAPGLVAKARVLCDPCVAFRFLNDNIKCPFWHRAPAAQPIANRIPWGLVFECGPDRRAASVAFTVASVSRTIAGQSKHSAVKWSTGCNIGRERVAIFGVRALVLQTVQTFSHSAEHRAPGTSHASAISSKPRKTFNFSDNGLLGPLRLGADFCVSKAFCPVFVIRAPRNGKKGRDSARQVPIICDNAPQ